MSAIFFFEKGAAKKTQIFYIFERLLLRNLLPYWYVDVFWETSVGFLKGVALQLECQK